jgi:hypothetical protein
MTRLIFCLLLAVSTPAVASDGVQCNANGAVVTLPDGTVYYLGKSCDAARKGGGTGVWFHAASFLGISIDGEIVEQIHFDVDCPSLATGQLCPFPDPD